MIAVSKAPNRFFLLVIGLVLLAIGTAALAVASGKLSGLQYAPEPGDDLLDASLLPVWTPAAVLGISVLLTVFGLWWAASAVPRSVKAREFQLHRDGRHGVTRLDNGALQRAVSEAAQQLRGVVAATVRIEGTADHPGVLMKVEIDERSDIASTVDDLHRDVLGGLETSLQAPLSQVRLIVDPVRNSRKSDAAAVTLD